MMAEFVQGANAKVRSQCFVRTGMWAGLRVVRSRSYRIHRMTRLTGFNPRGFSC